jgi:hypothetical protein
VIDFANLSDAFWSVLDLTTGGLLTWMIGLALWAWLKDKTRVQWARLRQRAATPWLVAMRSTFPMRRYLLRRAQAETERKMLALGFDELLRRRGERR